MSRSSTLTRLVLVAWIAGALAAPLAAADPRSPRRETDPAAAPLGCVIIIDGLRGDLARSYAQQGLMPNLKANFVDRGVWVDHATSVMPSITGAALPSIVTGAYPGRHDVPSLTFFDRSARQYRDLYTIVDGLKLDQLLDRTRTRTVFEYFPASDDTWSFCLPVSRGADKAVSPIWSIGYKPTVFRMRLSFALRELKTAITGGDRVRLTVTYCGHFDHMAHLNGATAETMKAQYQEVDWLIGKVTDVYRELGLYDRTYFVIVSDHGHRDLSETHDIWQKFASTPGLPTVVPGWIKIPFVDIPWSLKQPSSYDGYALVVPATDHEAFMYLARPGTRGDFTHGPSFEQLRAYPLASGPLDVVAAVRDWQPVDLVVAHDAADGTVRVYSAPGAEAVIERKRGARGEALYRYRALTGDLDPLGYLGHPGTHDLVVAGPPRSADDMFFTGDRWHQGSVDSSRPDGVVQLCQIFDSPRAPDLLLCARRGHGLVPSTYKSSHGGLSAPEMHATLAFAGPGLAAQTVPTGRIVDMVPTLLHCMQVPADPSFVDGVPLPRIAQLIPGPGAFAPPVPAAPVDAGAERVRLLENIDDLQAEWVARHDQGEFDEARIRQLARLVRTFPREGKRRVARFVRGLAAEVDDPTLRAELLASLH